MGQDLALGHADHARAQAHDEIHIVLDDDEAARREVDELFLKCYDDLSEAQRDEAHRLVEEMRVRSGQP